MLMLQRTPKPALMNIGAEIITNTIVPVPYYNYSIMGPKPLFQLLRPLYQNPYSRPYTPL